MAFCNSNFLIIILQSAILLISSYSSFADTNGPRGSLCSNPPGNDSSPWTANLDSVFSALQANVNLGNRYYKAEAGKDPDRAFGLIQCRGDLSPSACREFTKESFSMAARNCGKSKTGVIWQSWCLLRYSNSSFYGVWEKAAMRMSANVTSWDDPGVADRGLEMMSRLVADSPNERLMFATSKMEDGRGWKRYGLAQCTRDLMKSDCRNCLDYLLKQFEPGVKNKTAWEIFGVGCFLLYDDHQFYFKSSSSTGPTSPATSAANRALVGLVGWFVVGTAILATAVAHL